MQWILALILWFSAFAVHFHCQLLSRHPLNSKESSQTFKTFCFYFCSIQVAFKVAEICVLYSKCFAIVWNSTHNQYECNSPKLNNLNDRLQMHIINKFSSYFVESQIIQLYGILYRDNSIWESLWQSTN